MSTLNPCRCGHAGELNGLHNGLWYELRCPQCKREASAFTKEGLVDAWNEAAPVAKPEKAKRPPCENRSDFESDHPGPFDAAQDAEGNELDEYANGRTQADWLLWLRAQAAAGAAAQELMNQIDQLRAGVGRVQNRSV